MPYEISDKCTNCGACLDECPSGSITRGSRQYFIDAETCAEHASCVNVCPAGAITLMMSRAAWMKSLRSSERDPSYG